MFSNADQEAILHFIFSREANVELALGVLAAGQSIRERIIKDFLKSLETELGRKASQLGDSWKVVNEFKTGPYKPYWQIYITKQPWDDLYRIAFGPKNASWREFILGVWNNLPTFGQPRDGEKIRKELTEKYKRRSHASPDWPFYMSAYPDRDWVGERILLDFRKQGGVQAASTLAEAMLDIAQKTESVINTLVDQWRGQQLRLPSC